MNTILQSPTPNLQQSLDFYKKLNFKVLSAKHPTLVTDGKALLEINPERTARAGVKLFKTSWQKEVKELKKLTTVLKIDNGYLLSDASNVWVYLIEGESGIEFQMEEKSFGLPGNFSGLSLEAVDIARSIKIWEILDFKKTMGSLEEGWILFQNADQVSISLMKPMACPHLFVNPSFTYFNGGKNLPVIQKIRDAGIPITEEITVFNKENLVDNIIIRDPGGFGFFIFND